MAIYVKTDYVPEECKKYLTPNKLYQATEVVGSDIKDACYITDDTGDTIFIIPSSCASLRWHPWTVIEDNVSLPTIPSKEEALECLEDMDDYSRMSITIDPGGPYNTLKAFIEYYGGK